MLEFHHTDHNDKIRTIRTKSADLRMIEIALRKKLNKEFLHNDWCNFFTALSFNVQVCNICKVAHVPFHFDIETHGNTIKITNVVTPRQYAYCYGKSEKCQEMSRGRKMNPNSAKFISLVMGIPEDDAKLWIRNNNKSSFYKENHASGDAYRESQSRNLDWFKKKYGDAIGLKKFEESIQKQNHGRSLSGYIEKYGIAGGERYQAYQMQKDSMSYASFRNRNPEMPPTKLRKLWMQRSKSVGLTREHFIEKHGIEKYLKCMKKRLAGRTSVSKWSLRLIEKIKKILSDIPHTEICYGLKNELCIHDIENRRSYYYDLYVGMPTRKIIIEFNGSKFHADPRLTEDRDKWKNPFNHDLSWDDSYAYDKIKLGLAEKLGYETLVVWDFEPEDLILNKVKEFIHGN